ncbi:MAG: SGNH/GDSL hydrolase family protein [Oscillospiraceae bacterium]|nr:SGNH/GDSL hydrolase family protein [Oscillospiraceae bacterium]MBQ9982092.1 SGNH/GDSL hydrolase family protein [Oscillospiraceae bacterium]
MRNNYRLKKTAKKAIDGGNVEIVYLGGSATAGYILEKGNIENNFAKISFDYFCRKTKNNRCTFSNYAVSGADAFTGLAISDKYIKEEPADVVFIEYALNNGNDDESILAFESLVRKIYNMENKPAIVLVLLANEDFSSSGEYMKTLGEHYGLPVIDICEILKTEIESGNVKWNEYSFDSGHPTEYGHEFIASCINKMWDSIWKEKFDKELKEMPTPYFGDRYQEYTFVNFSAFRDMNFSGFRYFTKDEIFSERISSTGESQSVVSFTARFKSIFLMFESTNNINCGEMHIYIDNNYVENISGYSSVGRDDITSRLVYKDENEAFHDVKVLMKNKDGKSFINLIGVGLS